MNNNDFELDAVLKDDFEELSTLVYLIDNTDSLYTFICGVLKIGFVELSVEEQPNEFYVLCDLIEKLIPVSIVVENDFEDAAFTDSYCMCFAQKRSQISKYCKRILIFACPFITDDESRFEFERMRDYFVGSIVIRPLDNYRIGRSLLNAKYYIADKNAQLVLTDYDARIGGCRLSVNAFPFSMQDTETTTCADITIINLLDYFSKKFQHFRCVLPSEIVKVKKRIGIENTTPPKGLRIEDMVKILSEFGFSPRLYSKDYVEDSIQLKRIMHYYIESGFPVAIGINYSNYKYHSIICIGHGKPRMTRMIKKAYPYKGQRVWLVDSSDLYDDYYVMDDTVTPYKEIKWKQESKEFAYNSDFSFRDASITNIVAPLDKQIFLEAEDAFIICSHYLASFESVFGIHLNINSEQLGTKDNPLVLRLFLATAEMFKDKRLYNFRITNDDSFPFYASAQYPSLIWVCEIYSVNGFDNHRSKAIGEIVLDSTASKSDNDKVILIRYGNRLYSTLHNRCVYELKNWGLIDAYDYNLQTP